MVSCNSTWCPPANTPCDSSSPCDFGCARQCGFNAGADVLYWTVCQSDLDFAADSTTTDDPPDLLGLGDTHFLDYDWCPGVRGYFGIEILGVGLTGGYTWIKNKATGYKDYTNVDAVLVASLLHPNTGLADATIADGVLDSWYQDAELVFSKEVEFCDDKLILRPFIGARWVKIKQDLEVTYEGGDFVDNAEQVRWDSTVSGYGAHAGFELFYRWVCGIGMYGKVAGSVIGADTDIEHLQVSLDSSGNDLIPPTIQITEHQHVCVPGYQVQAGFTWGYCCSDRYYFRFRLGYEFNQWLNIPEVRRYHFENVAVSDAATDGHFALHGGTFGFDLRF